MNKQIALFIIVAGLMGGVLGSLVSSSFVRANPNGTLAQAGNPLQNFYEEYIAPLFPNSISSSPLSTSSPLLPITTQAPAVPYSPPVDYEQAVISAVKRASPAVVSVIISKNVPIIEQCPYNPFSNLPPEFQQFFGSQQQFYEPCQKGTKLQEIGGGSGFIISKDGYIVTNKHVISDAGASYTVFTNDGKKYDAKVIARDPAHDLAILKIEGRSLPTVVLGDSGNLQLGQTAISIGNALGEFRNTVSVGVISGLSRSVTAEGGGVTESIEGLVQTDAAINPGNSGGPLLNLRGEVIAINVAMASGAENIGFSIPMNQVKKAIESVQRVGTIVTPYVGVRYQMITPDIKDQYKLSLDQGAYVHASSDSPAVVSGSPAAKAGIQEGDIIVSINGEKLTIENTLGTVAQKYNVGDTVTARIRRNGQDSNLKVTLEKRPENL